MLPSEETRIRLLRKFRVETSQNLSTLRTNLANLSQEQNQDIIVTMFFAAHTIKGNIGMMQLLDDGLEPLNEPAGQLESLMLALRNQEISPGPDLLGQLEQHLSCLENQFNLTQELPQ